jgi:predicted porin
MKKSLLALAVLGAFAGAASAQSSVTLSGMLDQAAQHTGTKTGYAWALGGAGSAFNNFTISGREDLGGGMYSFFNLNMRFRTQNGTINSADVGTQLGGASQPGFFRQDWVGLGGSFGAVRLGRMLMPLQEMNGNYDIWYGGYTVASTHTGGITATIRANNAIYYRSPNMGGLVVDAAIAAGKGQTQFETQNNYGSSAPPTNAAGQLYFGGVGQRPIGFSVQYTAGPLKVGVAYDRNYADYKTTGLYAQYNFGFMILNGQYEDGDSSWNGTIGGKEKVKAMSISADIPVGPVTYKVGYLNYNSDVAKKDAHKFGLGGEYAFSKRTLVYSDIGKSAGDRLSSAALGTKYAGADKTVFDLGLRVKF